MTLRTEFGRILITGRGAAAVATAFRQSVGNRYQLRLAERDVSLLHNLQPDDEIISFDIADIRSLPGRPAPISIPYCTWRPILPPMPIFAIH
jgi:hypothetical protein